MKKKELKFTIGRSTECDIVLADDSVSRLHAELIYLKDGNLFITDCHSMNGITLIRNGKKKSIRQEFLSLNDTLQFGDITMTAKELSEAIPKKIKSFDSALMPDPQMDQPPQKKPWVKGSRLVRCDCGAVKPKKGRCRECGQ